MSQNSDFTALSLNPRTRTEHPNHNRYGIMKSNLKTSAIGAHTDPPPPPSSGFNPYLVHTET
jgi:hypothetical protein